MSLFDPPVNRSMTVLDRSFFKKTIPLVVAVFSDPKDLGQFVKNCKQDILFKTNVRHVVTVGASKGILLKEDITDVDDISGLSPEAITRISSLNIKLEYYNLDLDYTFWKSDQILRSVLPEELSRDIPTGFAIAGHLAHLNLREEFKPYGLLIGQVILDKNTLLRTVVDKIDTIDTQFRTFQMKILAGADDFIVEQSESGCKFKFDFSKVYWNSRLSTEHERLISKFSPGAVVCDVFAGVGPFVIPAAKKNAIVLANDLNPESYHYLKENVQANNVGNFVRSYNLDGREMIRRSVDLLQDFGGNIREIKRRKIKKDEKEDKTLLNVVNVEVPKFINHYVMNLPDSALTFLNEFIGLYSKHQELKDDPTFELPVINAHCFEKYSPTEEITMEDVQKRVHARIVKLIDFDIQYLELDFHLVRKVAPTKPMFCVSFVLPEEVAFRSRTDVDSN